MSEYDENKHICIEGALPDNYPWSDHFPEHHLHKHPSFFHYLLHGLSLEYPSSGAAVSGLISGIREFKHAIVGIFSVPAVFSVDVEDGDLVRPISYQEAEDREILEMMVDLKNIPDAIWVPALKYPEDLSGTGKTLKDFLYTDSEPAFYGVAYKHINRVMVGPLVFHPKFEFRTGDKIFVAEGGKVTTEPSENLVGVCISPGYLFLSQEASMLQAAMEEVSNILSSEIKDTNKTLSEAIEKAKKDAIKDAVDKVQDDLKNGNMDVDDTSVSIPGRSKDRTLSEHFNDDVNVKDFGAAGDGVTNDDAAFDRAIKYCLTLGDEACIFLPVGTYLLSKEPGVPCYGPGRIKVASNIYKAFELLFTINGGIKRDSKGRYYVDLQDMLAGGSGSAGDQIFQSFIETAAQNLLPSPRSGGLGLDKDNKLVIDLKNLTNAQRAALTKELILSDGGIVADASGKLYVNFDQMDTKKFEDIAKAIRVPIWITSNKDFYVNGNTGSDTLDDGRGESTSKPFKTINACLNYITTNYNVNTRAVTVQVSPGTYAETLSLGDFSRTTGSISIRSTTSRTSQDVTVSGVNCSGGSWSLYGLRIVMTSSASNNGIANYPTTIFVGSGRLNILGCYISHSYAGPAPTSGSTHLRICTASNTGVVSFQGVDNVGCTFILSKGNATTGYVLVASQGGYVHLTGSNNTQSDSTFYYNGEWSAFAFGQDGANLRATTAINYPVRFLPTSGGHGYGKRFHVISSSHFFIDGRGPDFFPGDEDGYVDEKSYSYYG